MVAKYLDSEQVDTIVRQTAAALEERLLRAELDVDIARARGASGDDLLAFEAMVEGWRAALDHHEEKYSTVLKTRGTPQEPIKLRERN